MIKRIPSPVSGGLILSYRCPAECRHCIYACSRNWEACWMSEEDIESILGQLAGKVMPAPYGPGSVGLNHGLHFTGGEPFLNFDLLSRAVEIAGKEGIPSIFVETNCFWCGDDKTTGEKLRLLKSKGLKGIMISVNPFYLEFVPFERTERAVRLSLEVFGRNVMVYQPEYFRLFHSMGLSGRMPYEEFLARTGRGTVLKSAEFFVMGRAPYKLKDLLGEISPARPAERFFSGRCFMPFRRGFHNHFDNYGNYMPGFCCGVSLGDCRRLDDLLRDGVDTEEHPVLGFLMEEDLEGLHGFALDHGYETAESGYFSRCHLCTDLRRHLALSGDFKELSPLEFYRRLDN